MPASARTIRATAALSAVAMASLTACGSGDDSQESSGPAPTAWTTVQAANPNDAQGEQQEGENFQVIPATDDQRLKLSLPADGSPNVANDTWPDVRGLVTQAQLKGIYPPNQIERPSLCSYGTYANGQSPKNLTQCGWVVKPVDGAGNSDVRIHFKLRGFGADSEVLKSWDAARTGYRNENVSGDKFYVDGTYGTRRLLIRDSGLASIVISDGQIAGWFDIQFPTEPFLSTDLTESKNKVRTHMLPTLAQTLVTYLPRSH